MPKHILLLLALTVIFLTGYLTLVLNAPSSQSVPKSQIETAINQANHLYSLKKQSGEDLSKGPCLSDALMPDWVVDIVHSPRQAIDDLVENQCPSFRQGRSRHFVELDTDGNLVRAE